MSIRSRCADQQGATFVILAVFMVALFGFAGLSIDVGNTLLQRKKIQEACDAAALAAVVDWAKEKSVSLADVTARNFAQTNGMAAVEVDSVEVGVWLNGNTFEARSTLPTTWPANVVPAVRVVGRRVVDMTFARVVGMNQMHPRVEAVAVVGVAQAAARALPWAVCDSFIPVKCMTVTLQFKDGGEENACSDSGGMSGNFGQLTLPGGSGSNWYRNNIENGYDGILRVGQCLDTDTGVAWGPTRSGIDDRLAGVEPYNCTPTSTPPNNKRLAIIPKVATLDVSGKKSVCITGFYVVSLDGYESSSKTVTATFIETYAGTEVDPTQFNPTGEILAPALVR